MSIADKFREIPALASQPGIVDAANILDEVVEQMRLATATQAGIAADRFARLLTPERHNRPRPAAAVVTIQSETVHNLSPDAELNTSVGDGEYTFSPVYDTTIYPISLHYIGVREEVHDISGEGLPRKLALRRALPQGLFLLGLQLNGTGYDNLEGLQLLFQNTETDTLRQLSSAKLYFKDRAYRLAYADFPEQRQELTHTACDHEFLLFDRIRRSIAQTTAQLGLFRLEEVKDNYVLNAFTPEHYGLDLSGQEHSIAWAQLVMPEGMDAGAMVKARVALNALPIFNAFSSVKIESLESSNETREIITSIPVAKEEAFLALGRVWTRTESPYLPQALSLHRTDGTYELGVRHPEILGSLDIIGLIDTLGGALHSANPAALASLSRDNRDALQSHKQSLETIAKEWKNVSLGLRQINHNTHYLKIRPNAGARVVYVEVWRTNTALASTLLPSELDIRHTIPECDIIRILIPPDKINYQRELEEGDNPLVHLEAMFSNLTKRRL